VRQDGQHISHVITIGEDITEWRQAQQRLSETEKLAAVGQLAAGVMHEINNPLATILACCEALALRSEELAPAERQAHQEYLKIVDAEVQRCRRIVDSLLDFSRPRSGDKRQVDVNAVVEQTLFLLKHHTRFKRLTVARELAPGLPAVLADQEKLIQSFMALMLNAMDAMDSRGTLTVRSRINPERRGDALRLTASGHYDLLVLDLRLPTTSGLDVLRTLRDRGNGVPVLVLTAQDAVDFKVQALRMGADDYVTKPFSLEELVARVEALGRRPKAIAPPGLVRRSGPAYPLRGGPDRRDSGRELPGARRARHLRFDAQAGARGGHQGRTGGGPR